MVCVEGGSWVDEARTGAVSRSVWVLVSGYLTSEAEHDASGRLGPVVPQAQNRSTHTVGSVSFKSIKLERSRDRG